MNPWRMAAFFACALTVGALLLWGALGLAPFGYYPGPYGDILNHIATAQRHVLNVATAINFDYRGFDTLLEEYIFFTAATGVVLVFRARLGPNEKVGKEPDFNGEIPPAADGIGWLAYVLTPIGIGFALYIAAHAQLTPGGGFQGGAIAGSTLALIYLGLHYVAFTRFAPREAGESLEAIGAGAYAVVGLATLVASGVFLENILPLGTTGNVDSSGTIAVINGCVFAEVTAGFVVVLREFFDQTRRVTDE